MLYCSSAKSQQWSWIPDAAAILLKQHCAGNLHLSALWGFTKSLLNSFGNEYKHTFYTAFIFNKAWFLSQTLLPQHRQPCFSKYHFDNCRFFFFKFRVLYQWELFELKLSKGIQLGKIKKLERPAGSCSSHLEVIVLNCTEGRKGEALLLTWQKGCTFWRIQSFLV